VQKVNMNNHSDSVVKSTRLKQRLAQKEFVWRLSCLSLLFRVDFNKLPYMEHIVAIFFQAIGKESVLLSATTSPLLPRNRYSLLTSGQHGPKLKHV
jgi:hypothetical protein